MIITSSPILFNETIQTQAYAILDSPTIHMSDTSVGSGRSTSSERPLHAEFVSPTSQLVGDAIDSITMKLKKTNSPTGIAQIGVFNADLTVKKLFGTVDSATMSTDYTDLKFSLSPGQTYKIQSGDLIGIKFTGGDSINRISTMIDDNAADPFDGINSYHTYYTTFWNPFPTNDLYMILSQSGTGTSDTIAPVTTATPPGGFYSTSQSVTLTANEPATIYYTTNGSIPTVSSTVYTTAIPISATSTLKFFAKDIAGNIEAVKTQTYTINTSSTSDIFGIKQIYPTKTSGNTWFMNMANPSSDPRFDSQKTITKNADSSWKMKGNPAVRMNAFSTSKTTYQNTPIPTLSRTQLASNGYMQLPSDWKNFEMTGYVKLNAGSNDDFTWYGRGGSHNDASGGCQGSAYKAELSFNGGTRFAKETWHVSYDFTGKKSSTPSILDKWTGFKFVLYNKPGIKFAQQAQGEIWVDLQNNNNWVKVDSFVDDGWGSGASHCGPATAENMPITWGGPIVDFRADNSSDFDFKYLSVREIASP